MLEAIHMDRNSGTKRAKDPKHLVVSGLLCAEILNKGDQPSSGPGIIPEARRELRRAELFGQTMAQCITRTPVRANRGEGGA
jgi:hypothetical protein